MPVSSKSRDTGEGLGRPPQKPTGRLNAGPCTINPTSVHARCPIKAVEPRTSAVHAATALAAKVLCRGSWMLDGGDILAGVSRQYEITKLLAMKHKGSGKPFVRGSGLVGWKSPTLCEALGGGFGGRGPRAGPAGHAPQRDHPRISPLRLPAADRAYSGATLGMHETPATFVGIFRFRARVGLMSEGEDRAMAPPPLSAEFRKQTRGIHSIADRLVRSRMIFLLTDRTLYAKALSCFYLIHKQLDECLYRAITKSDDAGGGGSPGGPAGRRGCVAGGWG